MNDELQKALAVLLQKTTHAAETGAAFLQAELPEVIRQLLMWKAIEAGVICIVFLIFAAACGWALWKCVFTSDGELLPGAILAGPIFLMSGFLAVMKLLKIIQILIAPKVYLIEYAASLAR